MQQTPTEIAEYMRQSIEHVAASQGHEGFKAIIMLVKTTDDPNYNKKESVIASGFTAARTAKILTDAAEFAMTHAAT